MTCSIGVAGLSDKITRADLLVHCADKNMCRTKHNGRNRLNGDDPGAALP